MSEIAELSSRYLLLVLAIVAGIVLAPRLAGWVAKTALWVQARRGKAAPLYGERRLGSTSVGRRGFAKTEIAPRGKVRVQGETWSAVTASGGAIAPGEAVEVVAVEGLVLTVRPAGHDERSTTMTTTNRH